MKKLKPTSEILGKRQRRYQRIAELQHKKARLSMKRKTPEVLRVLGIYQKELNILFHKSSVYTKLYTNKGKKSVKKPQLHERGLHELVTTGTPDRAVGGNPVRTQTTRTHAVGITWTPTPAADIFDDPF